MKSPAFFNARLRSSARPKEVSNARKGGRHTASPREDLQRQVLLGEEDFVERFKDLSADKE
jgi:hypothetical protein